MDRDAIRAELRSLLGATRALIELHQGAGGVGLPEVGPPAWPPMVDDLLRGETAPPGPLSRLGRGGDGSDAPTEDVPLMVVSREERVVPPVVEVPPAAVPSPPLFEEEPRQPSLFGPGEIQETPRPRQIRPAAGGELPPPRTEAAHRRLEVLSERIQGCTLCALHQHRRKTVFARGNPDAELCFVGEAPGADEDEQGLPFVGKAGQLLDRMIAAMGMHQEEVYITNLCRCRPPGNRTPTPQEMDACLPYLHEQLALVQPRVIVALGATASRGLLQTSLGIKALRGTWKLYRGMIPLMPTYHPAYLLRETEAGRLDAKRDVWKDLQAVLERLGRPLPTRGKK